MCVVNNFDCFELWCEGVFFVYVCMILVNVVCNELCCVGCKLLFDLLEVELFVFLLLVVDCFVGEEMLVVYEVVFEELLFV